MDEVMEMQRPWGAWYVLEHKPGSHKVKRLELLSDHSISLQYHIHRSETWVITQGQGRVIVDAETFDVKVGDTFVVPKETIHQIKNTGNVTLVAIEVQIGEITEESDIVRV